MPALSEHRQRAYLAVDMGASSGRHVLGLFDGRSLELREVHRFDNGPVAAGGHLYWDLLAQWTQVCRGLAAAKAAAPARIESVAVDTWGVDFGLLGPGDELLTNPVHYRDPRTDGLLDRAFAVVPRREIFAQTGLQFMQFNTLYQLWAMRLANSSVLDSAERLLMIPDLFHWLLTGEKANEFTNATTTQCFDPQRGGWADALIERFAIPRRIFADVVPPGTVLGPLRSSVVESTGLSGARVVLPGTHDTASAVVAVPAAASHDAPNWCYISSGTWSLMGAEVSRPIVNDRCLELNFTNEGGVGGTTRLLKNIAGLWLLQECRRIWNAAGADYSWESLAALAAAARPLGWLIDPDNASFLAPADMPEAICDYCRRTGQGVPQDRGSIVRAALDGLALRYRLVLSWLEQLVGRRIETIYIVGGGAQNRLLCQAAADACSRTVLAGPTEATALGNLLVQAIAAGDLGSVAQAREVVRASFAIERYEPKNPDIWHAAFERFVKLAAP